MLRTGFRLQPDPFSVHKSALDFLKQMTTAFYNPPDHARRIFAALPGPKRLILVPNAKHNESLQGTMWQEIERWIDSVLPPSH